MNTVVPPPPSGSILQKQSSFSRPKAANASAATSGAENRSAAGVPAANASATIPSTAAQRPEMTVQRPAPAVSPMHPIGTLNKPPDTSGSRSTGHPARLAAPPGMWGPKDQITPGAPAMPLASGAKHPAPAPGAPAMPLASGAKHPAPAPGAPAMSLASGAKHPAPAPGAPAMPLASGAKHPAPAPGAPAMSLASGAKFTAPPPTASPASSPAATAPPSQPPRMARQSSIHGNLYSSSGGGFGSMYAGQMVGYGSMGPGLNGMGSMKGSQIALGSNALGGCGSMGPGQMTGYGSMGGPMVGSAYGAMGAPYGSMAGSLNGMGSGYGSMNRGMDGGASAYGSMCGHGANPYGSMGGENCMGSMTGGQTGSMYGMGVPSSMMGGSIIMPMGSMCDAGGAMGSMYGVGGMSTVGIAAQWGSLANMSMGGCGGQMGRSGISSGYGGFVTEATRIDPDDLCPNIGTFEGAKDLPRSGKRGGNHLYSRGKHEKPLATGNANSTAMTIRRKSEIRVGSSAAAPSNSMASHLEGSASRGASRASPLKAAGGSGTTGKTRAKVPSNYNVHSLILLDKAAGAEVVAVKDPSTIVFEKGGKKETFEVDEALMLASTRDDIDSVLLSELRGNWFNGHNSCLMLCGGEGRIEATQEVARQFLRKCLERLERNEKDTAVKFDVTMTMVSLRGADQCCDLLKSGAAYDKVRMGSSPVYGPCLLDLEAKVHKTASGCIGSFDAGLKNAKDEREIVAAFLILKTIKKTGAEDEVHLSSLCIALCGETVAHKADIRDKASSSPHRLFRYAVDGACVTVSGLSIASNDENAREGLEVERRMREVKNQPPRSGNVKRFVDYTYKEILRQKEKLVSASGSDKKTREAQIERMEEMIKDAKDLLTSPENTLPKGYSMGR
ncbi:hypothetical protein LSCM1_02806 [Leishmania martiniquensis]|uniref:Uncharacterized protein n=1 Tax=Leishmania martiniquensis TaxID=1580590 RepID=A0A836KDA3_9TRYP|nr:hypothetical protein LSCM1_02806 [Leishmania martiniquensis]